MTFIILKFFPSQIAAIISATNTKNLIKKSTIPSAYSTTTTAIQIITYLFLQYSLLNPS